LMAFALFNFSPADKVPVAKLTILAAPVVPLVF